MRCSTLFFPDSKLGRAVEREGGQYSKRPPARAMVHIETPTAINSLDLSCHDPPPGRCAFVSCTVRRLTGGGGVPGVASALAIERDTKKMRESTGSGATSTGKHVCVGIRMRTLCSVWQGCAPAAILGFDTGRGMPCALVKGVVLIAVRACAVCVRRCRYFDSRLAQPCAAAQLIFLLQPSLS